MHHRVHWVHLRKTWSVLGRWRDQDGLVGVEPRVGGCFVPSGPEHWSTHRVKILVRQERVVQSRASRGSPGSPGGRSVAMEAVERRRAPLNASIGRERPEIRLQF